MLGQMAPDIVGTSPDGSPLVLSFGARQDGSEAVPVSAALFLTSSCEPCLGLWAGAPVGTGGVAVVTPDPTTEDARKIARLAPSGLPVAMSSQGWHDYGVTGAPWLVAVDDRGVVVSDGPAPATWVAIQSVVGGP
jgi:hypothetical protein